MLTLAWVGCACLQPGKQQVVSRLQADNLVVTLVCRFLYDWMRFAEQVQHMLQADTWGKHSRTQLQLQHYRPLLMVRCLPASLAHCSWAVCPAAPVVAASTQSWGCAYPVLLPLSPCRALSAASRLEALWRKPAPRAVTPLQVELTNLQVDLPRNSFSCEVYTLRSRRARLLLPVSAAQLEAMKPGMDRCGPALFGLGSHSSCFQTHLLHSCGSTAAGS